MKILQYNKGQALLISVVMFLFISTAVGVGILGPSLRDAGLLRAREYSLQSLLVAESVADDMYYRLKEGMTVDATEILVLNNATGTATHVSAGSNERTISGSGDSSNHSRSVRTRLTVSSGASFNYGVQSGEGGFVMTNTGSIVGNAYSSGPIIGSNSNIIRGDVISAGPSGLIDGIHATGTAYAHTITNSTIDGSAYYQTISNTTVGGGSFPGTPDQSAAGLPISDELIEEWKTAAALGGTLSSPCPYVVNTTVTLGSVKINCDLNVSGSGRIILTGPVWVNGDISISNNARFDVSSSVGNASVAVIADKTGGNLSGGRITITNSSTFYGNGGVGSYVLLLSQNNAAENGNSTKAITVSNSAEGDLLLYAGHGEVELSNTVSLKEVTAYKIRISNSAEVIYDTGLASLLFTSGPGGSWERSLWEETD